MVCVQLAHPKRPGRASHNPPVVGSSPTRPTCSLNTRDGEPWTDASGRCRTPIWLHRATVASRTINMPATNLGILAYQDHLLSKARLTALTLFVESGLTLALGCAETEYHLP